jgi:transcriptional regulator with XRE-family HTH domain
MKKLDKNRFLDNVKYLLNKNNIRIGQLESEMNVSTGYLSRFKESDKVYPPLEMIEFLCNKFNVSMEDMLYSDLQIKSSNEILVKSFLNKIILETKKYEISWKEYDAHKCNQDENYLIQEANKKLDYELWDFCYLANYQNSYFALFGTSARSHDYYLYCLNGDDIHAIASYGDSNKKLNEVFDLINVCQSQLDDNIIKPDTRNLLLSFLKD